MHLDDTPIKFLTEIIVLGKLLKEIAWSKPARRVGRYISKKICDFSLQRFFLKESESRRRNCGNLLLTTEVAIAGLGASGSSVLKALEGVDVCFLCIDNDRVAASNLNRYIRGCN